MRILCVLCLALVVLSCAKKSSLSASAPDKVAGTWRLGASTEKSCFPVPGNPLYFFAEEQVIKQEASYYSYQVKHKIFTDKACTILAILQTFEGNYSVGDLITNDTDKTRATYKMTHSQTDYKISVLDVDTLNRANLMTAEGLQAGARLCNLTQDWVLNQVLNVTDKTCSLGIATTSVEGGLNILAITLKEQNLVIGSDTFGNFVQYPLVLIEQGLREWYKLRP